MGESFAGLRPPTFKVFQRGHYVPAVASSLVDAFDAGLRVARPQGVAMGNAWVSPDPCLGTRTLRSLEFKEHLAEAVQLQAHHGLHWWLSARRTIRGTIREIHARKRAWHCEQDRRGPSGSKIEPARSLRLCSSSYQRAYRRLKHAGTGSGSHRNAFPPSRPAPAWRLGARAVWCSGQEVLPVLTAGRNPYDLRQACPSMSPIKCYNFSAEEEFLNDPKV